MILVIWDSRGLCKQGERPYTLGMLFKGLCKQDERPYTLCMFSTRLVHRP